jgi:hypothetical protein
MTTDTKTGIPRKKKIIITATPEKAQARRELGRRAQGRRVQKGVRTIRIPIVASMTRRRRRKVRLKLLFSWIVFPKPLFWFKKISRNFPTYEFYENLTRFS